jgi:cytochrome oxidase Cu insertion factor (SCO1/SenC/PrrC family)
MFAKMVQMQRDLAAAGVKQVCVSVDPERDTPAVLKEKLKDLGALESNWTFLTGDRASIDKLMRDMFQPRPQDGDSPLMHDSKFYLFDADGKCRRRYSSSSDDDLAALKQDAAALAAANEAPAKSEPK